LTQGDLTCPHAEWRLRPKVGQ